MRRCTSCGTDKDVGDFYAEFDGRPKTRCKSCCIRASKRWRNANRDRYNASQNQRRALMRKRGIAR